MHRATVKFELAMLQSRKEELALQSRITSRTVKVFRQNVGALDVDLMSAKEELDNALSEQVATALGIRETDEKLAALLQQRVLLDRNIDVAHDRASNHFLERARGDSEASFDTGLLHSSDREDVLSGSEGTPCARKGKGNGQAK